MNNYRITRNNRNTRNGGIIAILRGAVKQQEGEGANPALASAPGPLGNQSRVGLEGQTPPTGAETAALPPQVKREAPPPL